MSGVNHVAGGIVLSGIYLAFFDINIYSSPWYLFFTAVFSILADIDHTKSLIGKLFYPIAWYLGRYYGHRTITHSLVFYVILGVFVGFAEQIFFNASTITKIFFWSYGSHLILDMLTLQGIPLFYPYKKNPCVIPGNPSFRFKSGDFKTEFIMLTIFGLLLFTTKDLFANGFWNTYNKKNDNLTAVNNERKMYDKIIKVDFEYIEDGNRFKDTGYLIATTKTESIVLTREKFHNISLANHIVRLNPIRVDSAYEIKTQSFTNITVQELNSICRNKSITELNADAILPLVYTYNNKLEQSKNIKMQYIINPFFNSTTKSDSLDGNVDKEIALLTLELAQNTQLLNQYYSEKERLLSIYSSVQSNVNSPDLATKERAMKDLPSAKANYEILQSPVDKRETINTRLQYLKSKTVIVTKQSINGYISYFIIKK